MRDAPRDVCHFRNQLSSLQTVINEVEYLQCDIPAGIFSERLISALADVEEPLHNDIATLRCLLKKTSGGQICHPQGWDRIKFRFKSGEFEQLGQRLGAYRDSLCTVLLLMQKYVAFRTCTCLT